MSKVIAVSNQKGGTGKTTTTVNLGIGLANKGKKVLLIDFDAQGSLTQSLGYPNPDELSVTISTLMEKTVNEQPVAKDEGILHHAEGVNFVPANIELSGMETALVNIMSRERVLKNYLSQVKDNYDYVLIDCPPSLGILTLNAFTAADSLLVPLQCEYYAMEGVADLTTSVKIANRRLNKNLYIEGILLTMYDNRLNFSTQVAEELRRYFGARVYDTVIPRNVRLAEAPSHGRPITEYDAGSKGARAYLAAAEEFLQRQG